MTVRTHYVNGALRWYSEPGATYHVDVTCARCGSDTEYVTGGSRWHWQQAAVVRCSECNWSGVVNMTIQDASKRDDEDRRAARERRNIDRERVSA